MALGGIGFTIAQKVDQINLDNVSRVDRFGENLCQDVCRKNTISAWILPSVQNLELRESQTLGSNDRPSL